jgi:hypothetical protein
VNIFKYCEPLQQLQSNLEYFQNILVNYKDKKLSTLFPKKTKIRSDLNLGFAYQQRFDEKVDLKMTMHFGLRDAILRFTLFWKSESFIVTN